jgi:acetyl-CoA decarbonylase/synthase complex subunit alpha
MADKNPEKIQGIGIAEMRGWDMILLGRYRPRYHALSRVCTLCGLSPCDLDKGRRGTCGQDLEMFLAREALILAVSGAAAHAAHARDVVERLRADRGDFLLDLGERVQIRMPIAQIVAGTRPERLADLEPILEYVDAQIVRLLASAHFGGESAVLDLESKTMQAGTMDLLSMEITETAQIAGYRFPSGRGAAPRIPLGPGNLADRKPLILCIGHHSAVGHRIVDRLDASGQGENIHVVGLCCTAHEMVRYSLRGGEGQEGRAVPESDFLSGPIVIGNLRDQLSFIRSGRADVVVVDQQCIRPDLLSEATDTGAFFIATSDLSCRGLPGDDGMDMGELASDLIRRTMRAVFVPDPERAAGLAVTLAEQYGRVAKSAKTGELAPLDAGNGGNIGQNEPTKMDDFIPDIALCSGC